jgi:hypothetical protein
MAHELRDYRSFLGTWHLDPIVERLAFDLKVWEVPTAFMFWTLTGSYRGPEGCALPDEP